MMHDRSPRKPVGCFKKGHIKSFESQELRSLLVAGEFFVNKLRDHEKEVPGLLRPFVLKVGTVSASGFAGRFRELVAGNDNLKSVSVHCLTVAPR